MTSPLAEQLLEAHVAHAVQALTSEASLAADVRRDAEAIWAALAEVRLDDLVTPADATRVVLRVLGAVPGSVTASTLLEAWTDLVLDGPPVETSPADLVDRDQVEAILGEVLANREHLGGGGLDRLADAPAVGALASRFISRIVMEAVQANREVAERIPGVGSMLSLGTSAASKVAGVADRPLQAVGDTAGKGAAIAARRLTKVVRETVDDPVFAAAVLEVWDLQAAQPLAGLSDEGARAGVHRLVGLVQEAVIGAVGTPQVEAAVAAAVGAVFDVYGEHPVTVLVEELGLGLPDVVAEVAVVLPRVTAALQADGTLERLVRAHLEPFYRSAEVARLLDGVATS